MEHNLEASSGNEWTFPLGVGASKTTFIACRHRWFSPRPPLRKADGSWRKQTKYLERGQEYVYSLHALMKTNMLMETDDAHLGNGPVILLTPVGEGV